MSKGFSTFFDFYECSKYFQSNYPKLGYILFFSMINSILKLKKKHLRYHSYFIITLRYSKIHNSITKNIFAFFMLRTTI